jgi:hypothetical protein
VDEGDGEMVAEYAIDPAEAERLWDVSLGFAGL